MMRVSATPLGSLHNLAGCLLAVVCNTLLAAAVDGAGDSDPRREFFKPPSPCLTGPSCQNCVETIEFFHFQVCCFHCRLDNLIINNDVCHCIDTRLPDSFMDVGGNCSSGQICDNCAVKISSGLSEGLEESPGRTNYCCQDCGIVMPYLHRDDQGCHCTGNSQGRVHQAAPRYDPAKHSTTTTEPDVNAGGILRASLSSHLLLHSALLLKIVYL